jgi:hypothetical protein
LPPWSPSRPVWKSNSGVPRDSMPSTRRCRI